MQWHLRPANDQDITALREIERASGQGYRDFGLDNVADDEPASVETLATYIGDDRAWVITDEANPVGYILVDAVDGLAHIEQVSVLPEFQGKGGGRALIERVIGWATAKGRVAVTLTTFGHIPWNRPLYEHLGFRVLSPGEIGPGLAALREMEAAHGLNPDLRVAMRLDL